MVIEDFFRHMVKGAKSEMAYRAKVTIQDKFSLSKLYLIYANRHELAWGIRWIAPPLYTVGDIQKAIIAFVEYYTGIRYSVDCVKVFDRADDEIKYILQQRLMKHFTAHDVTIESRKVDEIRGRVFITLLKSKRLKRNANVEDVSSLSKIRSAAQFSLKHLLPWVYEVREISQK